MAKDNKNHGKLLRQRQSHLSMWVCIFYKNTFLFSLSLALLFIYLACWLFYRENNKPFGFFFLSFYFFHSFFSSSFTQSFCWLLLFFWPYTVCAFFPFIRFKSSNVILQLDLNIFSLFSFFLQNIKYTATTLQVWTICICIYAHGEL